MAAANILTTGTAAANSGDVAIAAGTTVGLKGVVDSKAFVKIALKDDAGGYNVVGELTSRIRATVIVGAGTYRFTRVQATSGGTCGVYSA